MRGFHMKHDSWENLGYCVVPSLLQAAVVKVLSSLDSRLEMSRKNTKIEGKKKNIITLSANSALVDLAVYEVLAWFHD